MCRAPNSGSMAHGTRVNERKGSPLMAWDFSTDPEFEAQLEWMRGFVAEEIEPLDLVFRDPAAHVDPRSPAARAMAPLKEDVKKRGLWACHRGPDLGGMGLGQRMLGGM